MGLSVGVRGLVRVCTLVGQGMVLVIGRTILEAALLVATPLRNLRLLLVLNEWLFLHPVQRVLSPVSIVNRPAQHLVIITLRPFMIPIHDLCLCNHRFLICRHFIL